MPPFKSGLLKRKSSTREANTSTAKNESDEEGSSSGEEELFRGELDGGEDSTDSEHELDADADSDHEQDGVLFEDDVDSTLGEEDGQDSAAEESSDLTDSEEDGTDDSNADSNGGEEYGDDDDEDSEEESLDSGAESGAGLAASSDEADKTQVQDKKQKGKVTKAASGKKGGDNETQQQTVTSGKTERKQKKAATTQHNSSVDRLSEKVKETSVNIKPVEEKDEYESGDTSDEEDRRNAAGDVPTWWYDEYPHLGYDVAGRRLLRPPQRDRIDDFLRKCEDPDFWRTVRDPATGQDVRLSKDDLQLIQRVRQGLVPRADHDEYQPWVEWFSREVLAAPLRAFPDHKRSFLPSRSEQRAVSKIVHALKMGWAKTRKEIAQERRRRKEKQFYNLWGSSAEEEQRRGIHKHIPAPRRAPPSHAESYNPPPEYLLDAKEMKEWNKLSATPWQRKYSFLPTRHGSLRAVPAYGRFVRERFLRCLDLYLAPRAVKMRLTISPDDLVPRLPSPRSLQPFPTAESLRVRAHRGPVRGAGFDPSGQYLVSGGADGTVKVWETSTGRCLRTVRVCGAGEGVSAVAWTPAAGLSLVAAAAGRRLLLLNPGAGVGAHRVARRTDDLLQGPPPAANMDERTSSCVRWDTVDADEWARGVRLAITHFRPVTHVSWHARGDYVCVTLRDAASRAVLVHQVSRRASQLPFARARGLVQCALFHPTKPLIFVATQRVVRVYDLVRQELVRKLQTGAQWVSALAVHPAGDNLLVASYDRKCLWFDLELSARPYQTLRLHGRAVRGVAFHARYPLFATAGDDRYVCVSHGQVYSDLLQNPLLVPLKQLPAPGVAADGPQPAADGSHAAADGSHAAADGSHAAADGPHAAADGSHAAADGPRVLQLAWHPTQPWLLAAGADGTLRLYT